MDDFVPTGRATLVPLVLKRSTGFEYTSCSRGAMPRDRQLPRLGLHSGKLDQIDANAIDASHNSALPKTSLAILPSEGRIIISKRPSWYKGEKWETANGVLIGN